MSWFKTHSEEETIALGRDLAQRLPEKAVVLLIGNLGAGKTALAKGILSGLGVATVEEVTSPTFTLIHEYGDGRAGRSLGVATRMPVLGWTVIVEQPTREAYGTALALRRVRDKKR